MAIYVVLGVEIALVVLVTILLRRVLWIDRMATDLVWALCMDEGEDEAVDVDDGGNVISLERYRSE